MTVIAFFCSTFLSWPIAVVLTLLLLLGRWGVDELGDALEPGSARGTVTDLFGVRLPRPGKQYVVTDRHGRAGGDAPARGDGAAGRGAVPGDRRHRPRRDDPGARLGRAAAEVAFYGLPLLMLTYVILRNKEVAP